MTVTLKQRTWRDLAGNAVGEPPPTGFLIGPEGGRITDATAVSLGLVDGFLPESKEGKERADKMVRQKEDKTGRIGRQPAQGQPMGGHATPNRPEKIADLMRKMQVEADEGGDEVRTKLFTADGRPDLRVLSGRFGDSIKGPERDAMWATVSGAPSPPPQVGAGGPPGDSPAPPNPDDTAVWSTDPAHPTNEA